jgi:hypothetical protein
MTPYVSTAVEQPRKASMSLATRLYIAAVIAAGALVLVTNVPREYPQPTLALTFLAAMLVVSLFKLRLPLGRGCSTMSMAYVVDFLVLVTAGPDLAMAIASVGVVVQCTVNVRRKQPWYRAAFSVASVALAVRTAGWTWSAFGGSIGAPGAALAILPLAAAAGVYFAINTGLVAAAIALSTGSFPLGCWRTHFVRTAPGYVLAATVVASLELVMRPEVYLVLPAAAVPMILGHMAYAAWFRSLADRQPAPV